MVSERRSLSLPGLRGAACDGGRWAVCGRAWPPSVDAGLVLRWPPGVPGHSRQGVALRAPCSSAASTPLRPSRAGSRGAAWRLHAWRCPHPPPLPAAHWGFWTREFPRLRAPLPAQSGRAGVAAQSRPYKVSGPQACSPSGSEPRAPPGEDTRVTGGAAVVWVL